MALVHGTLRNDRERGIPLTPDVIAGLQLEEQVFAEPPAASFEKTILDRADKYIGSQSFYRRKERANKLKNPSPEELSIAMGIPLWLMNMLQSEMAGKRAQGAEPLRPMAEKLRSEHIGMLQ